jgi:hypothetical protein
MRAMRTSPLLLAPVVAGLFALAACDQPKFRDKGADAQGAPAAAAAPAQAAPPPRVIPTKAEPVPQPPAWAAAVMGKNLRAAFPKTGICKGNTDIVDVKFTGEPAGTQLLGWGWDVAKKARVGRVVLVDANFLIVGAGEGGAPRPDVSQALPDEIKDPNTGWTAVTRLTAGPLDSYGVVGDGDAVCVLGHLEF